MDLGWFGFDSVDCMGKRRPSWTFCAPVKMNMVRTRVCKLVGKSPFNRKARFT